MSLGIGSAKLGAQDGPQFRISRNHKVAPSIAEQAIFIPKPHKRVTFTIATQETQQMGPLPGSGKGGTQYIPLTGAKSADGSDVKGTNIKAGSFGVNGVSARFNEVAWKGQPNGYVKMEVDLTPSKQHDVIATQEEGRQINHKEIHFTQQYDAYGRPRIGFSREPYDFAATKFVSVTSQLSFQANMQKTKASYDEYLRTSDGKASSETQVMSPNENAEKPKASFLGPDSKTENDEVPVFGNTSEFDNRETKKVSDDFFLGAKPKDENNHNDGVSAKEAFENQKVNVVDVFAGNKGGGHDVDNAGDNSNPKGNSGEMRSIDLTV